MINKIEKKWLGKSGVISKGPLPDVRRVNIWPEVIKTKHTVPKTFKIYWIKKSLVTLRLFHI